MEAPVISKEEWLEVWDSTSQIKPNYNELKREFNILQDFVIKLEYRISKLEEKQ